MDYEAIDGIKICATRRKKHFGLQLKGQYLCPATKSAGRTQVEKKLVNLKDTNATEQLTFIEKPKSYLWFELAIHLPSRSPDGQGQESKIRNRTKSERNRFAK
jgi:hypothetical protein